MRHRISFPNKHKATRMLYNEQETAAMLDMSIATLQRWRCKTTKEESDLPYVKVGASIKYRLKDIEEYIERHTIKS